MTSENAILKFERKSIHVAAFTDSCPGNPSTIIVMNCNMAAMSKYDFLREPQIGTLSEISPYTILIDQGRNVKACSV